MCGIAGILYSDVAGRPDGSLLRAMAEAIAHRGPDAEGFWTGANVGLAHRRLSIIDLAGGTQPLGNEDGSVQVVFNGEIYNHRELQRELASRGHRFRTRSDTEVLVHLYEELGERLVERLRGMFAFAIWDVRKRRLVLARDRVGLKPLYVYRDNARLLFGSEIKALLADPDVDRSLDPRAVEDFLTYGVIPGERSIFRAIRKLPAAHTLVVSPDDLVGPEPRRYWRLNVEPDESATIEEWLAALEAKFGETVAAHRIADVPVGAFLSGGVDSGAIVSEMVRSGERPRTFSIGFEDRRFSELPDARRTADLFGTEHVEEVVTAEAISSLDDLVRYYDEPFADSSAIPTLAVSRLAREHVKVVTSGDGGDEAFGGYARYAHDLREDRWRGRLPGWFRRGVLSRAASLWPKADWLPRPLRAKTTLENLALDPAAAYANTLSICRLPLRRLLLHGDVVQSLGGYRPEERVIGAYGDGADALGRMIATDVEMLLPDDFLVKVDRASMAVGLEVRPPLVDHEFLELAARVPSRWKIRGGETKWLFKQMVGPRLPGEVVSGRKRGFEIPIDDWLRGPLAGMFRERVLDANGPLAELIDGPVATRVFDAHGRGTSRQGGTLWALLVLAAWVDRYATPDGASTGVRRERAALPAVPGTVP